ncbi:4-hydroxybenzoate polyprenyltransferase, mitochondrial-like, partial [Morus notabilis]|uniref:4-hydroxybenzoate polyprenyltransferase, mitochondrial-like n=1 Tax=Morus notabilis TaxID=981085 RepID=UPI000CED4DCC
MTLFLLSRAFRTRRFLNPSSSSISSSFHYAPNPNPSPLHISPPIPVFLWPKQFYYGRRKLIVEFGAVSVRHISTSSSSSTPVKNDENGGGGGEVKVNDVSWINLYLPKHIQPYARLARLDKPIGTWLLAWPCM